MPSLTLNIISAKLSRELNPSLSDQWQLSLVAKLDSDDRLRLTTGEDIKDVIIYANFRTITEGTRANFLKNFPKWKGAAEGIGVLSYFPLRDFDFGFHPATLSFEHWITNEQFADLIELAHHGRFPSRLDVQIADDLGMKYGWEPDGRGKDWDTKSNPRVPIESVQFDISIAEPPTEPTPPISIKFVPLLQQLLSYHRWALFLLLLIVLMMFVHH